MFVGGQERDAGEEEIIARTTTRSPSTMRVIMTTIITIIMIITIQSIISLTPTGLVPAMDGPPLTRGDLMLKGSLLARNLKML